MYTLYIIYICKPNIQYSSGIRVMIGIFSGFFLDPRSPGLVLSLQRQAAGRGWEGSMGRRVKDLIISKYPRVDLVDFILETWKMFFFLNRTTTVAVFFKESVGLDQDMRPPVRSKADRWEWEVRCFFLGAGRPWDF